MPIIKIGGDSVEHVPKDVDVFYTVVEVHTVAGENIPPTSHELAFRSPKEVTDFCLQLHADWETDLPLEISMYPRDNMLLEIQMETGAIYAFMHQVSKEQ